MGVSVYNIKRWFRMLTGRSIYHVDQNIGKVFKPGDLSGYFNDMTQKVIQGDKNLEDGIPFLEHSDGIHVQMPTMIFQYGLGAFDLWLIEGKKEYKDKAIACANWALDHQENTGAWSNFFYIYPEHAYSAMPQGEGVSLLLRVYKETQDLRYFNGAKKAIEFMLIDVKDGGVSKREQGLVLLEYTHLPVVLNGWIFALAGLYDYYLVTGEKKEALEGTIDTLKARLHEFDCGYWSQYDESGKIASPFYHNLHIAQMEAMFQITKDEIFRNFKNKWRKEQNRRIDKGRAFIKKAIQKVVEK